MSRKSHLTIKEQQKLKVLLEAIEGDDVGDSITAKSDEKQEAVVESTACIDQSEIQRFIDLGLGRGIDASDPTPWQNKTSIQVRPVTFENIVGTEESGSVKIYEREITRVSETHWRFSPSAVFNPNLAAAFSIGVEESHPHSQSSSKKYVVGTKVLNRTICFKEVFDDNQVLEQLQPSSLMFEAWLCRWILKKYVKEDGKSVDIEARIETLKKELLALNEDHESLHCEHTKLSSKLDAIVAENSVENIKAELQELEHKKKVNEMEKEKMENKKKWFLNTLEKDYKKMGQTDEKQYKLEEFDQDFRVQEMKIHKERGEVDRSISLLSERCEAEMKKQKDIEAGVGETKNALDEKEALLKEKTAELKKMQSHQFSIDELRRRLGTPELQHRKITEYCAQFLAQFRVTHYVSSIQLGASGYKVVTKGEAAKSQKVRNSIRVDKIAAGKATSAGSSSKARSKKGNVGVSKIGIIQVEEDNKVVVKRKSHQEGVVGVQMKPVSDLVTTVELREPLMEGILHYVRSEGDTSGYNYTEGPFLIRCEIDNKIYYWRVDDFHSVKAECCDATEATQFYIRPRSHLESHLNEFNIVYYDSPNKKHADPYVPHYLQRSVTIFGSSDRQQLKFGHYAPGKDTPLALYKDEVVPPLAVAGSDRGRGFQIASLRRRNLNWSSVSLASWINEPEPCIIRHSRHGSFATSTFIVGIEIPGDVNNAQVQQMLNEQTEEREGQDNQEERPDLSEEEARKDTSVEQQEDEGPAGELQPADNITEQEPPRAPEDQQQATERSVSANEDEEVIPLIRQSEYQVLWIESTTQVRVIKSFEIVPTRHND